MMANQITIGGSVSFHYYKINLGGIERKILLFGDEHTQYTEHDRQDTINITTLLKKIIRKTSHCVDFYSENVNYQADIKAKGKALQRYDHPLDAIRKEFGGCPIHNFPGQKCYFDNLRYHNWDLRFEAVGLRKKWKPNPYDEILMESDIFEKANKRFSKISIIKYILGFPISRDIERKLDSFFDTELETAYQKESFAKAVSTKDILYKRRALIQREYKKVMKTETFPKDFLNVFINSYRSLGDVDYTLVFTDFYMLCRMFMRFSKSQNKKTPKKCPVKGRSNYATPRNIIVYAGDEHITDLITFFKKMFNAQPIYTTGTRCHLSKKIHVKDISLGEGIPKPKVVDDLFRDFY